METFTDYAANAVLLLHGAYIAIVVFGLPLIWLGAIRGRPWARDWRIRGTHLAMIVIVVVEAWLGITCPLTTWEHSLRQVSGQTVHDGPAFFAVVHGLIFWDAEPIVFAVS